MSSIDDLLAFVQQGGSLSRHLKGFESRVEQQEMIGDVWQAYEEDKVALIEAGTGTGKSLAYLLPAITWAAQTGERTVISTHTIALQEQLLQKDIPLILDALGIQLQVTLVKGMQQYVCLRKLEEQEYLAPFLKEREKKEMAQIQAWANGVEEGCRSTMGFHPSPETWEKVHAENDSCTRAQCPHYKACHFMKSRRKLADAKLLVTNHHLLFADIAMRKEMGLRYDETAILPPYERLVLDEAHHIEDIATAYFSSRVGYVELIRLHAKLTSEKSVGKGVGRLPLLKEQLSLFPGSLENEKIQQVEHRLRFDLPIIRRELTEVIAEAFLAMGILLPQGEEEEKKVRLHPHHCQSKEWQERVVTACEAFFLVAKRFQHMVLTMENDLRAIEDVQFKEKFKNLRIEILSLITRFEAYCQVLKEFVSRTSFDNEVCWIEQKRLKGGTNTQCITAKLDLSDVFAERLFNSLKTTVLCSATLTAAKTFDYLKGRLGLTSELLQRGLIEKIYNSPFDFSKQALLVTPSHLPDPRDPEYLHSATEAIWAAVEASRGRTFVLFTSYRMLQECAKLLRERFSAKKYTLLKQGDHASNHLLRQFVSAPHAVLFGTDSFWEGVDVVGEDLQCVILVKLPFKVPTEPLIQARAEHLKSQGKDPFMDYALPLAIMKFKQGFGRLVRHREDRGCVVCLDTRLIQKNYGQLFLQSLPNCPFQVVDNIQLFPTLKSFFGSK